MNDDEGRDSTEHRDPVEHRDSIEHRVRRILVALDASPHSLAALAAAVDLAAGLGAEVEGLFVEDIELLRMADLPVTREVGAFTALARDFDSGGLERQLRVQAARAERALSGLADPARVSWTFRVARGAVAVELLAAARGSDLITVGRAGWSPAGPRGLGSTLRALLADAPRPVLVLRPGRRLDCPLCVLYDGSPTATRALEAAVDLLPWRDGNLRVFILPDARRAEPDAGNPVTADPVETAVRHWLAERGHSAQVWRLERSDPATVASTLRAAGGGALVLPAGHPLAGGEGLAAVMDAAGCGVLVVR